MKDRFNLAWGCIFIALYILIMLPLPCFVNYVYVPTAWGVPNYIWGWLIVGITTIALILVWSAKCLKRPEYHEFDERKEGK